MTGTTHEELSELPPSALLVWRVLEEDEPRTLQDIREDSYLCKSTARKAVRRLQDRNLIDSEPDPDDARRSLYHRSLTNAEEETAADVG